MKLVLLFLGVLAFVWSVYSSECRKGPKRCLTPLINRQDVEMDCDIIRNTKRCFQILSDRCPEDNREEIGAYLYEFVSLEFKWCEQEVIQCIEVNLLITAEKCFTAVFYGVTDIEDDIDVKCEYALRFFKCMSSRIAANCGAKAEKPVREGLFLGLKKSNFSEIAESPLCALNIDVVKDYEYDMS